MLGLDGGFGVVADVWSSLSGGSARVAAKDARLLIDGKLPAAAAERSMKAMRDALYKKYPNLLGHDKLANLLIRRSLSESFRQKD
jgi:hypothetical protein